MSLPPGTSKSGISDPSLLVETTLTELATNDYDFSFSVSGVANESASVRSSLDTKQMRITNGPGDYTYIDDQIIYENDHGNYTTRQAEKPFEKIHDPDGANFLEDILPEMIKHGVYSPDGTVQQQGRTLHRFSVTDATWPEADATVTEAGGNALVSANGILFKVKLRRTISPQGQTVTGTYTFSIDELGDVDVREPSWVDLAKSHSD